MRISLHVLKPKFQASVENKLKKFHKLSDVYVTVHGQLRCQCYCLNEQNPKLWPRPHCLSVGGKKDAVHSNITILQMELI